MWTHIAQPKIGPPAYDALGQRSSIARGDRAKSTQARRPSRPI